MLIFKKKICIISKAYPDLLISKVMLSSSNIPLPYSTVLFNAYLDAT